MTKCKNIPGKKTKLKAGLYAALILSSVGMTTQASAANLITNGDFELGNTGFTSDYTFNAGVNFNAAEYTVGTNPQAFNGAFVSAGDHTTGFGNMMIVNGSQDLNDIVWQSDAIAIAGLTNYFFEAFVMNVFPTSPPNLTFTISLDGGMEQVLDTLSVPNTVGVWNGLSTTFNSGGATNATLRLRNAQIAFSGNDFAIDDISLSTQSIVNPGAVPEPATWAFMIAGFGAIGGMMRRQRETPKKTTYA